MFGSPWRTELAGRQSGGSKRSAWILITSLLLHGVALTVLCGFEAWVVPAVAEPPATDVFVVQLPPPALQAAPTRVPPKSERQEDGPKAQPKAAAAPQQPPAPAASTPAPQPDPRSVNELVPQPAAKPLPPDPPPGPAIDGSGTHGNGNGNGSGSGTGPGGGLDDGPLAVGGLISRPQIVPGTKVEPRYTEPARQARLQGVVILRAVIDERGNVIDVHVVKPLRFGLDDEAVRAVSQWKFTPALLAGRPVKVYFDLTVRFELR